MSIKMNKITKRRDVWMFKIGRVAITRHNSYNNLKHYIANQILLTDEKYLPSVRELSEDLSIAKSSISRALLLLSEQDKWLKKIQHGNSPRNCLYKIVATPDQAEEYKNYYLLPVRKKLKFRKMFKDAGQSEKVGQFEKVINRDNLYTLASCLSMR